ncbi:hypothetical protein EDB19DRAFT_1838936 [Suillus lakei]|nr:hypothetical protein EDB19DRAFT_1838936 [Suillus lakei]
MTFTSRFTILALLTFLAGANAECATCNATLEVGTTSYELVNSTLESANGFTLCTYLDNKGDKVTCEYSMGMMCAHFYHRIGAEQDMKWTGPNGRSNMRNNNENRRLESGGSMVIMLNRLST